MATGFYLIEVTMEDGGVMARRPCGSMEIAKRAVLGYREEFPDALALQY